MLYPIPFSLDTLPSNPLLLTFNSLPAVLPVISDGEDDEEDEEDDGGDDAGDENEMKGCCFFGLRFGINEAKQE